MMQAIKHPDVEQLASGVVITTSAQRDGKTKTITGTSPSQACMYLSGPSLIKHACIFGGQT
jgi:hypothetical protein